MDGRMTTIINELTPGGDKCNLYLASSPCNVGAMPQLSHPRRALVGLTVDSARVRRQPRTNNGEQAPPAGEARRQRRHRAVYKMDQRNLLPSELES